MLDSLRLSLKLLPAAESDEDLVADSEVTSFLALRLI